MALKKRAIQRKPVQKPLFSSGVLELPNHATVDLALARERMIELTSHRGLSTQRQRAYLQRQQDAIDRVSRVVDLHNQGLNPVQIARQLRINKSTVRNWLKGKFPADFMSEQTVKRFQAKRIKIDWNRLLNRPVPRAQLAYCIGAMFGNLSAFTPKTELRSVFTATLNNREFANRVAGYLRSVSGSKSRITRLGSRVHPTFMVTITNADLAQFVNRVTQDQSQPPYSVLKTQTDFREFVRGYWDSRGHMDALVTTTGRKAGFLYMRTLEPAALEVVKWYLKSQDIAFRMGKNKLFIEPESFAQFKKTVGFTDPAKQQRLIAAISN